MLISNDRLLRHTKLIVLRDQLGSFRDLNPESDLGCSLVLAYLGPVKGCPFFGPLQDFPRMTGIDSFAHRHADWPRALL
jgi:hypothetical protein